VSGIAYVNDFDFPFHDATGKSPWITVNGEHVADSQVAVEFVARKMGKDIKYVVDCHLYCI
jgi:hypothetical protein